MISDKSVHTQTDGKRNTWTRMEINKQQEPLKCPKANHLDQEKAQEQPKENFIAAFKV